MKPFEHLLILSDLDNTFLGKRSRVVPENLAAIDRFKKLGGKFSFATGRDPFALLRVVKTASEIANYPCIVTNGAYVYDFQRQTPLDEHPLKRDALFPIFADVLERHPDVSLRFSTSDRFLTPRLTPSMRNDLAAFADVTEVVELHNIPSDTVLYKAVFHSDYEHLCALREDLLQYELSDYSCYFSCPVLFEVLDREGTKGNRMQMLKQHDSGIRITFGVGDHENDRQLLENADYACCPENAIESIQSRAQIHLCHCDHGAIADLIERIEHSEGGILI